jgi:ribonuclease-3
MTPAPDGKKGKRPRGASARGRGRKQAAAPRPGDVKRLAAKLKVVPRRTELFLRALTHKSAEQELGFDSNERLEFLGDAVLGLVLAEHLHRSHPELAEGDLTKLKAVAVSEPILAAVGRELEVGRFLVLAKGEELTGGRDRSSILADAVEAIFAATYLDRGYRIARELILRLLADHLAAIERREYEPDYKTLLQEQIQEIHRTPPTYRVVSQSGPDHDRTFVAEARIGRRVLGTGTGKSKKQAEQAAAREAVQLQE